MERRSFLKRIGLGAGAVVAVPTITTASEATSEVTSRDEFTHNGYVVKWRDFIAPANHNVLVGMWLARHQQKDLEWVSTTGGQCYPCRAWEVVDLTHEDGWPMLTVFADAGAKQAAKERALYALMGRLNEDVSSFQAPTTKMQRRGR